MYEGQFVFTQVMDHLPWHTFHRCVSKYHGNRKVKQFTCFNQYLCMVFAQLTYRESLRDTVTCLRSQQKKLYHMGIRAGISLNNLANANKVRDWRIYAEFAQALINTARKLYVNDDLGLELKNTVYALDSTTIDLSLTLFPWAKFRQTKAAVKLHTLLDLRGNIPTFIHITDGKYHDVRVLDVLVPEPGAFYIMDRAYVDFARLYNYHQLFAFFVTRAKSNFKFRRLYSHPVEKNVGLKFDQTVVLEDQSSFQKYPEKLRRIKYHDAESGKTLVFLTNNFSLPAATICELYRCRWQVELFFKWIKQNLRIKSFFGTDENAVKSQIWIAVSVYVLIAIVRKRLQLDVSLYTILQVLSITVFDKTQLYQLLTNTCSKGEYCSNDRQLKLFD